MACVYSTDVHGCSLAGLYARTGGLGPVVVAALIRLEEELTVAARSPRSRRSSESGGAAALAPMAPAGGDGTPLPRGGAVDGAVVVGVCLHQGLRGPASVRRAGGASSG